METLNEIEFTTATLKIEEGIMILKWKEDAEVDLPACEEIVNYRKELQKGKPALLLIDQRQFWSISKEAKEYSKQKDVEQLNKAIALLTGDWLPSILVANTYIKLYRPNIPMKIFKSELKAKQWLLSFNEV